MVSVQDLNCHTVCYVYQPQLYILVVLGLSLISRSSLFGPVLGHFIVPTLADRGFHVVSMTDPYVHILGFLVWSHYFFFQVAPQLYS
jgi:hypothetical protein